MLNDITALNLGTSTISGTLGVTTAGAVTQSGALNVAGTTILAAGAANNITLTNAANDFSTMGITSGNNVSLTDATALDLAASTVSGTFNVTAGVATKVAFLVPPANAVAGSVISPNIQVSMPPSDVMTSVAVSHR